MDLAAIFPLTLRHLGDAAPRGAAGGEAFVRAVRERHARGDIPDRGVRDLVQYEWFRACLPPAPPPPGPLPRDDEPCVLAPHVRVLVFGADLPAMLAALREGKAATPRPARGWIVLWQGGELVLPREEGWFIESFRDPTTPAVAIEGDAEERAKFERLWKIGVLVLASRDRRQ